MIGIFKHLLPKAEAWKITIERDLKYLFDGVVPSVDAVVEFFDLVWLDIFPQTTRHLTQWESTFGLNKDSSILLEQGRRDNLDALWQATGGQSPRYIQDTLQAAGFDVYVHDWWVPGSGPPPTRRDETKATYYLVNKLYTAVLEYTVGCGEAVMECGEAAAECGENNGIIFDQTVYTWPIIIAPPAAEEYILYIGGATWPDQAVVPIDRQEEFEDLCLKICPAHLWIGMIVRYGAYVVEDGTGFYVVEDGTGKYLLE